MRAVCSGTRGRGCCGWSDMVRPPEITAPTPLSTFRLTYSPTVSGPTWASCPAQKPRLLGIRRAPVTFLSTLARSNLRISQKRSARRALEFETERVLLALAFPTLPLGAAIGLWHIRAARGLLCFCLGGTLLQRRLGFLARFDVIDRPSFLAVRTAAL